MEYTIHIGDKPIILKHDNFDSVINVDDLTTVDTSNLFGEATTVTAAANRIGLLKSEVGAIMAEAKLDYKMFEANFKAQLRKKAAENGGFYLMRVDNVDVKVKLTESFILTAFENDPEWIEIKKKFIQAEKNFESLGNLLWSIQQKSRVITNLVSGTTPEDFVSEMIEGKVNGIFIKKKK